jgi:NodT family efflux transporter outer membrane factor (OMF) lipoprotein
MILHNAFDENPLSPLRGDGQGDGSVPWRFSAILALFCGHCLFGWGLAALLALALAGCTVGPNYQPPKIDVPAEFRTPTNAAASQSSADPTDLQRWWEQFHDATLNSLIAEAIASNLDVQLAEARVREARAQLTISRSAYFPSVGSSASYSRAHATGNAGVLEPGTFDLFLAGFDATWEIDVFGGTRRAVEAGRYTLEAQMDARRNALVTLLGDVARNYLLLRGSQQQLAIVRSNLVSQTETRDLQRTKLQAGIASDLDVANAEAQAAGTESQIPTLQTQIEQARHQLSVLLGREPAALNAELEPEAPLPTGPLAVPPGLPSELLRRRPDVRQAERQLAVATANIGVATADLYPKFNLTGAVGHESLSLSTFADAASRYWSFGPTMTWPIFQGGKIRANIRVQNARQEQALIQYRQAVLQSLQDVEDALVAYDNEQARRRSLEEEVASSRRAVMLARRLHDAGLVDFLNVLSAQQTLFQSEVQLAQSVQTVSTDLVALYKALGGGWESQEEQVAE